MSDNLSPRAMELLTMMRYKRPSGGVAEKAFIRRYLAPLKPARDAAGNLWVRVGTDSPIMWSSHTDTVHKTDGMQRITYGAGIAMADNGGKECLGADCTTGVWIMRHMIQAGIPGLYLFHAAEEIGGIGSRYIADKMRSKLKHIRYAIAFDRKGYSEIITHQGWARTASDTFATSLADALHLPLAGSDQGTFTDTANYADFIPECTNLAVGYEKQHTAGEFQDVPFAEKLLDAILAADFSHLACERDPATPDPWDWPGVAHVGHRPYSPYDDADSGFSTSLEDYVRRYPKDVADFLEMMSVDVEEIERCLFGGSTHASATEDA